MYRQYGYADGTLVEAFNVMSISAPDANNVITLTITDGTTVTVKGGFTYMTTKNKGGGATGLTDIEKMFDDPIPGL
jgi:hypothetical protein